MNYEENDTVKFDLQNNEEQTPSEEKKVNKKVVAGVATGAAAVAAGAGAMYFTNAFGKNDSETPEKTDSENKAENVSENANNNNGEEQQIAEAHHQTVAHTAAAPVQHVTHVHNDIHVNKGGEINNGGGKQIVDDPNPKPEEPEFLKENEVEIERIETVTEDGETAHVAYGTVNGHNAVFVDDGEGHISYAIIDENDNGMPDPEEFITLEDSNLSMGNLAANMASDVPMPDPDPDPDPEIEILAVNEDVDLNGHLVDTAVISVDDEKMVLIDETQNGEADYLIADKNQNGEVDDDEVHDISDRHIAMPTQADVTVAAVQQPEDLEIQVVAVENDVDMNGETVDVAAVVINDNPTLLVDESQNGEVDLIMADGNQNGALEENEVLNVTDQHIVMPTEADVTGSVAAAQEFDDVPDYTNDADTTMYDA